MEGTATNESDSLLNATLEKDAEQPAEVNETATATKPQPEKEESRKDKILSAKSRASLRPTRLSAHAPKNSKCEEISQSKISEKDIFELRKSLQGEDKQKLRDLYMEKTELEQGIEENLRQMRDVLYAGSSKTVTRTKVEQFSLAKTELERIAQELERLAKELRSLLHKLEAERISSEDTKIIEKDAEAVEIHPTDEAHDAHDAFEAPQVDVAKEEYDQAYSEESEESQRKTKKTKQTSRMHGKPKRIRIVPPPAHSSSCCAPSPAGVSSKTKDKDRGDSTGKRKKKHYAKKETETKYSRQEEEGTDAEEASKMKPSYSSNQLGYSEKQIVDVSKAYRSKREEKKMEYASQEEEGGTVAEKASKIKPPYESDQLGYSEKHIVDASISSQSRRNFKGPGDEDKDHAPSTEQIKPVDTESKSDDSWVSWLWGSKTDEQFKDKVTESKYEHTGREVECPDSKCAMKVRVQDLLQHIRKQHPFALWLGEIKDGYVARQFWYINKKRNFEEPQNTWVLTLMSYHDHYFMTIFVKDQEQWFSWMSIISDAKEAEKYEYEIRVAETDGSSNVYRGKIHAIDENQRDIRLSGNCLVLTNNDVLRCITNEGIPEDRLQQGYDYRLQMEYMLYTK